MNQRQATPGCSSSTTILPSCVRSFSSCRVSSRSSAPSRMATGLRDAVQEYQPDIIVLDITLPPVSGIASRRN